MNPLQGLEKKKKLQGLLLFLFYCLMLFVVYARYYLSDMLPLSGDAINWITDLKLVQNSLAAGEFPFWNKFLVGGIPLIPSYTPIMLLAFLPIKEMVYVLYIGFVAVGGTFAYLYFRKIGCNLWAALSISTCYLLSVHLGGFRKSHTLLIFTLSLLPVILYLVECYFATRKLRWLLGSACVMALQFCVGFLQQVLYADLFLVIYLLAFGLHYRMKLAIMLKHGLLWFGTYLGLILWKLVPMLEQNAFFGQAGSSDASMDVFTSFSIHPIKLIQTIFPSFFGKGNEYVAFGAGFSSEMDIELFLGHMVVLLVLVGGIFCFQNFRVRFALGAMLVTYLYAALGAFPPLAKLLYHIPLLNGFRVPARILFLFLFSGFTIAALALSSLQTPDKWKYAVKTAGFLFGGILVVSAVLVMGAVALLGITSGFTAEAISPLNHYVNTSIAKDLCVMLLCLAVFAVLYRMRRRLGKYLQPVLCAVIVVITLAETLPFTAMTTASAVSDLNAVDAVSQSMRDEMGNSKCWDAFASIDGGHQSIISQNRATSKEIPTINAYITFNNPRLYRLFSQSDSAPLNFSGLLTGSIKASQNLKLQNSLLSMLGVKYIIDSSGILSIDQGVQTIVGQGDTLVQRESIALPTLDGVPSVYGEPIVLEPHTLYEIKVSAQAVTPQSFYVDFYAGLEYDGPEQQAGFTAGAEPISSSAIVNSGNCAGLETIYWRAVSVAPVDLELTNITITKLETVSEDNIYQLWGADGETPIFVNTKARDVLYVPDQIEQITHTEELYTATAKYKLDTVNYMEDMEARVLDASAIALTDIDFGYNHITAQVKAAEDTFVNFSQCYYPGWRAYVDGQRTELHMVNGLIMGIEVPDGAHEIQFAFVPVVPLVGAVASVVTLALLAAAWFIQHRREKSGGTRTDAK